VYATLGASYGSMLMLPSPRLHAAAQLDGV
jgi:hypothetical protein